MIEQEFVSKSLVDFVVAKANIELIQKVNSLINKLEPMQNFTNTDNPADFPDTTSTSNRFDLEQQILDCWKITDDIALLEAQGANPADFTSLATVYEFKFKQLWQTFEHMVKQGKFTQ
jgi:hypothetical protein